MLVSEAERYQTLIPGVHLEIFSNSPPIYPGNSMHEKSNQIDTVAATPKPCSGLPVKRGL